MEKVSRCSWANKQNYFAYHDHVWNQPEFAEQKLFAWLMLETQSIGLNFAILYNKQTTYAQAFFNWDHTQINANYHYSDAWVQQLFAKYPNLVKNKNKIKALLHNCQAYAQLLTTTSLNQLIWQGQTQQLHLTPVAQQALANQTFALLKPYRFAYLKLVTWTAYLAAVGLFFAHEPTCFLHVAQ